MNGVEIIVLTLLTAGALMIVIPMRSPYSWETLKENIRWQIVGFAVCVQGVHLYVWILAQ